MVIKNNYCWEQWLISVILATWEAEILRILFPDQAKIFVDPSQ
jgi:hypothetical protein